MSHSLAPLGTRDPLDHLLHERRLEVSRHHCADVDSPFPQLRRQAIRVGLDAVLRHRIDAGLRTRKRAPDARHRHVPAATGDEEIDDGVRDPVHPVDVDVEQLVDVECRSSREVPRGTDARVVDEPPQAVAPLEDDGAHTRDVGVDPDIAHDRLEALDPGQVLPGKDERPDASRVQSRLRDRQDDQPEHQHLK